MSGQGTVDIDDLSSVIDATGAFLRKAKWSKHAALEVFSALGKETKTRILEGFLPGDESCQFDACSVKEYVGKERGDAESAGRWLRGHLKSYKEFVEQNRTELDEHLKAQNCRYRLKVSDVGSKGGERQYYYLDLESVDSSSEEKQARDLPEGAVEYQLRQLPKPSRLIKPFTKLDLDGWRFHLYWGVPAVIYFFGVGLFVYIAVLKNYDAWPVMALYILIVWAIWQPVKYFYRLLGSRITIAPEWMTPLKVASAQLEMQPQKKLRFNGMPVRSIRLVRYGADCSVCGAPVHIIKGKGEFKGRLIGQCNEAGSEHLFSFDHVSKVGVPLRSNGYYGVSEKQLGDFYPGNHPG